MRTEGVMLGVRNELNEKIKNVQNATAMKVLNRFYKKVDLVE